MREVLMPMPAIEPQYSFCSYCKDKLMPGLKVYAVGSYDAKLHKLSIFYAHKECAKRAGIVKENHIFSDAEVVSFWRKIAEVFRAQREREKCKS